MSDIPITEKEILQKIKSNWIVKKDGSYTCLSVLSWFASKYERSETDALEALQWFTDRVTSRNLFKEERICLTHKLYKMIEEERNENL